MTKTEEQNLDNKVEKIAFVTYNRIGEGQHNNGVFNINGREIYIAQSGHKSEWIADMNCSFDRAEETRKWGAKSVTRRHDLGDMDHVFLYVGSDGGEEAIKQTRDISADKITYVLCRCNLDSKKQMINDFGNADAKIVESYCGGHDTMKSLLDKYL